ncbi:hypothetical protein BDV97DRAFT_344073 [Delphinella strobiligena]|nr:hypothetical protein BDV97DRAFT_344073 [Delphinella strobiligena]
MAVTANSAIDHTLRTIFKRCVQCPSDTPSCPSCGSGEVCSMISQSCTACASMTCIKTNQPANNNNNSGPNVGAIAGGVVGGVVVVALVTFLVWWFAIRGKRQQYEEENEEWEGDDIAAQKAAHDRFNAQRSERASVNSVATSFISRASNMIPIAYIPGVMNRDGRGSDNLNVPPVPPIPAARGPNSAHSANGHALFFKPGDLRDSTYSDTSLSDRSTFYGRPSITPSLARSSVATFRDDAIENPMPAQTIVRGKANVVSVNSSNKTSPTDTPEDENPSMDFGAPRVVMPNQSSSNTSTNPALNGASFGKPTLLTLTKKTPKAVGRFPVKNGNPAQGAKPTKSSPLAYSDETSDSEDDQSPHPTSETATPIQESPMATQSPFADPATRSNFKRREIPGSRDSRQSEQSFIGMGGLKSIAEVSSIIENATKRASRVQSSHGGPRASTLRDSTASPFGDEHET